MNHTWKIYNLKRIIADGMVTEATYGCESEYSGSGTRSIGDITLTTGSASDDNFINFEDLTQDNVLGWITGSVDTASIETSNSASIAETIIKKATRTKTSGTPW